MQPPSRGCVLKHFQSPITKNNAQAAAFARLCVETKVTKNEDFEKFAAAFARLCVETVVIRVVFTAHFAAAFARLCVETQCC